MKLRRRSLFVTLAALVAAPVAVELAPPPQPTPEPLGTHVGFFGAEPVQIPDASERLALDDGNEALAALIADLQALGIIG